MAPTGEAAGVVGGSVSGVVGGSSSGVTGGSVSGVVGGSSSGVTGGSVSGVVGGSSSGVTGASISGLIGGSLSTAIGASTGLLVQLMKRVVAPMAGLAPAFVAANILALVIKSITIKGNKLIIRYFWATNFFVLLLGILLPDFSGGREVFLRSNSYLPLVR
ncbi:MAG: hypothetical protein ACFFGZ_10715 [Candidatus Thorarchaeota archaeon]